MLEACSGFLAAWAQRFARIQVAVVCFEVANAGSLGGLGKSLAPTLRREVAPNALDASTQRGMRSGHKRAQAVAHQQVVSAVPSSLPEGVAAAHMTIAERRAPCRLSSQGEEFPAASLVRCRLQ